MKRLTVVLLLASLFLVFVGCPAPNDQKFDDSKGFTEFSFTSAENTALDKNATGRITGTDIMVSVPSGTDMTALVATFTSTGTNVTVAGTPQVSGSTVNDFSNSVVYTVTLKNGSKLDFTVRVAIPATEDTGFTNVSEPGDSATLTLSESSQTLIMIYAQNQESLVFPMGISDAQTGTLTHKFWLGETEVCNAVAAAVFQWAYENGKFSLVVTDHNGLDSTTVKYGGQQLLDLEETDCHVKYDGSFSAETGYENNPVTNISWYGAVMFCNWLTEMRDGKTNNVVYGNINSNWSDQQTRENCLKTGYRLPESSEWEYAARYRGSDTTNTVSGYSDPCFTRGNSASGAVTYYNDVSSGDGSGDPGKSANDKVAVYKYYWDGINNTNNGTSDEAPVKSLGDESRNALGLYDMSGNVWEWCFTRSGSFRTYAGGGWSNSSLNIRIGSINRKASLSKKNNLGFRLCRTAD